MAQDLNEIKQLLQQKIFNHTSALQFNSYSRSVLSKLSRCHTLQMGVHIYQCDKCASKHYQYHSCGDRHCPNCGGLRREQWIQDRFCELLPTSYFHIVFTLPQELRSLCMGNRKILFDLLFECAHYTLLKLSKDDKYLGATPGITSILHTHGQDLSFHPHIHSIVSGGGIDDKERWVKEKRLNGNFLFPRRAMEKIFKAKMLHRIHQLMDTHLLQIKNRDETKTMLKTIAFKKWNIFAKAPFAGPSQIIEYLGRYTHKVAITAHRIIAIDDERICFHYKDYADGSKKKIMTLTHEEFLRRFEQHILPKRFVKIRHAGFLTHKNKNMRIQKILAQFNVQRTIPKVEIPTDILSMITTGQDPRRCPVCQHGKLILIQSLKYHCGQLIDIKLLQNKGSPHKNIQP